MLKLLSEDQVKGYRRALNYLLNKHCWVQLPTNLGSEANNWVQNECGQHPWMQIYTDALKNGTDTGYAFMTRWLDVVDCHHEGGDALEDTSVFQVERKW